VLSTRRLVHTLVAALLIAAWAPAATAQDKPKPPDKPSKADLEQARAHFNKGNELYQTGDKEGAVAELKIAYRLTRNALLLYNIGLIHDEMKDKPIALHYYQKFLEDAPDDDTTAENRKLATERVTALSDEIAKEEEAASKQADDAKAAAADAAAAQIKRFTHEVIDEAPPGLPLDVVAMIPPDKDWALVLYYRTSGTDSFKATRMRDRFAENVARIPAEEVQGRTLQYYIEVKDREGKMVATSGRAASPNVVDLEKGAEPHYYADLSEQGSTKMVRRGDMLEGDPSLPKVHGPSRPFFDMSTKRMQYAKWGTTISAVAFLSTSLSFLLVAQSKASALEADALHSRACGNPPCDRFGPGQADLQSSGETFETLTNVSLVLGIVSAGVAGTLWYLELSKRPSARKAEGRARILAAPVVTDDFVGGAARIEF